VKVHQSILKFKEIKHSSILTIGTFDGVHIGHQKIIEHLNKNKTDTKDKSVILTFFPHPRMVLNATNELKMLNTIEEKAQLLEKYGLDHLVIQPFTEEFSQLSALDFVRDILVNQLQIKKLVIGYDHHFGNNREGNFELLLEYKNVYDFELEKITAQEIQNVSVSSTKIRNSLESGNVEKANAYLGYNYLLTGEIVVGKGLGRKINFPTVNLHIKEEYKLIPKTGVYIVKTTLKNKTVFGIMNIGYRPTIGGKNQTIEIHLLDFTADLYGKKMQIEILKRLRDEQKFDSIENLTIQIQEDKKFAQRYIIKNYIPEV